MKRILSFLTILVVLGTAGVAGAQVNVTGSIQGRVTDADGAALPGVMITVESPALIGTQTVYSGTEGAFRAVLLPRGTYTVTFALQGFTTIIREDLVVEIRRTTTALVSMALSSVEETITVTGRSPLVDIKSTQRSSVYTDDFRNALPETRGIGGDMMNLAPEATPSGSSSNVSGANFFGDNSTAFMIDGVNVTDPSGGSQFPFYSPDMFEVVELTAIGGSADQGKYQGVAFNVVTKSGGNEYHGEGNYFYQNNSFINDNTTGINEDMCPDDPDPCFEPPTIDYRHDGTFSIGGPLIRDKVWFFASVQEFYESDTTSGVSYPVQEDSNRFLGKFTAQLNADNRLVVSSMSDTYTIYGRPNSRWREKSMTGLEPSMNITPNVTWNSVLSPNAFLEVKYSGFYGYFDLIPFIDLPQSREDTTNYYSGGYSGHYAADRSRTNFQGSLSYFADEWGGDHSFKFGAEYERNTMLNSWQYNANLKTLTVVGDDFPGGQTFAPGELGLIYYTYLGDPYLAYIYRSDSAEPNLTVDSAVVKASTLYAQDDWTIADRVTLNLGLRLDHWSTAFKSGFELSNMPVLNDVSPRLGVNIDVFGDGRTSLNGFWGRFYEEFHGTTVNNFDPANGTFFCLEYVGGVYEQFCRDDPLLDVGFDPDLTNQYGDQAVIGIDHQITDDLALTARYIRKQNRNILGGEDTGTVFEPVTVTTELGTDIQIWNAVGGLNRFRYLTNNPLDHLVGPSFRNYNGVQFKVQKRMSGNWALMASLLIQEAYGNNSSDTGSLSSRDDPNDFNGYPGEFSNSRRYVSKIQGTYFFDAPIDVNVGFIINALGGGKWQTSERFSYYNDADGNPTIRLGQRNQTTVIEQRGINTKDSQFRLDLRLDKRFPLRGAWGDLGLVFDIFNVFNDDTITSFTTRIDQTSYLEPSDIIQPRIMRLGVRWQF